LIVMTAFISPFRTERELARNLVDADEFIEVHVSASLDVCEERDPKGLYKKARAGEIANFTGIDSAYEAPENPEVLIDTGDTHFSEMRGLLSRGGLSRTKHPQCFQLSFRQFFTHNSLRTTTYPSIGFYRLSVLSPANTVSAVLLVRQS